MLVVVAQCGYRYGVVDTNDNVVEWVSDTDLYEYVNSGVEIEGVSPTGVRVNPIYCVEYSKLSFGESTNIFDSHDKIRKGYRNTAEICVGDTVYKVRALAHVSAGSGVSLDEFSFTADTDGYFVKLSNGICTILPDALFNSLFTGIIDLNKVGN